MPPANSAAKNPSPPVAEAMPKRVGIGLNVLVQVMLSIAIFAGINRLNFRYYSRFDLSPQQTYTLSQATLNYLDKLTRDVEIYIVFARDSKLYGEGQTLLEAGSYTHLTLPNNLSL